MGWIRMNEGGVCECDMRWMNEVVMGYGYYVFLLLCRGGFIVNGWEVRWWGGGIYRNFLELDKLDDGRCFFFCFILY